MLFNDIGSIREETVTEYTGPVIQHCSVMRRAILCVKFTTRYQFNNKNIFTNIQ
jgi:hypothetical protein